MRFRKPHFACSILCGTICVVSVPGLHANTVADSKLGFTLTLPREFTPRPDLIGAKRDVVHAFQFGETREGDLPVLLLIEKMHGVIDRKRLTQHNMPPGFKGALFAAQWQGFEVDGMEVQETVNGINAVTYNVQIPLRREAIQVELFGRADHAEMLRTLLRQVLDGLKGESNWLSSALPPSVANWEHYGTLLLALAIGGLIAGVVVLWFISRSTPKGALVIAASLYIVGGQFSDTRLRELRLLSGVMRMLGLAAIILGVFYLLRKRKSKEAAQLPARETVVQSVLDEESAPPVQ